jgi:hypothetical protein
LDLSVKKSRPGEMGTALRRLLRIPSGWLVVACALHARTAVAEEPVPPTYSLSWVRGEGAESCPNGRALATEVERRLGRKVFDAAADRSFEVEVARFGDHFRSDVYVRDESGRTVGHRSLQNDEPGCAALLGATALAIALVIDPEAAARPPATPNVAAFEAPALPEPPAPAPILPTPVAPLPLTEPEVVRVAAPPEPRALVTIAWRAQVTGGLVPRVAPGFGLSFGARLGKRWGFAGGASYVLSKNVAQGIGSVDIGLTRASAHATFEAAQSESVRLLLALGPSLGALHVAVREPAPVTSPGDYLFFAADFETDLQLRVTKAIFLELGASAVLPLRRQAFLVRGQAEPVWKQPVFSGLGFIGVGAMFP